MAARALKGDVYMSDPKPGKVTAADGHVYHKSATANASTAPTNEATLKNADGGKGLTPEQLDFVTIVHYEYGLQGGLPTSEFLQEEYKYKANDVAEFYTNLAVKKALIERGVEFHERVVENIGLPGFKPSGKPNPRLTAIQLVAANALLDLTDNRSEKKKLQDLGISSKQYQSWLRDPVFSDYLRARAESLIGDVQHEAMLSLVDSVRAGRLDAIKYYHEITGRYVQQSANSGGGQVGDLQTIIIRIIEIIDEEVTDPKVTSAIAGRLKALVQGGQLAGVLPVPDVIEQPEIAQARALTPEVEELTKRGLGYNG